MRIVNKQIIYDCEGERRRIARNGDPVGPGHVT